jgi:hypothetical protein
MRRFWPLLGVLTGLVVLAGAWEGVPARPAGEGGPDPRAVARTRETVKMLDDLYKGYVVHVTATYVKARERTPAAMVTKKVFGHMAAKGWHRARLIDLTGEPVNKANVAKTGFEKRAAAKLKGGAPYLDEVATEKGKPVLRAATRVPVVMKACISCHPGLKEGELMGAIVYEVPIQ